MTVTVTSEQTTYNIYLHFVPVSAECIVWACVKSAERLTASLVLTWPLSRLSLT